MKELQGKRLLLLGSAVWKDLIKSFADTFGVRLYFAGLYPSPLDNMVEEFYRIDTTDPNVMIPFVKEHKFDGIYMGGSEFIVSNSCSWINKLGLPCYCSKEQWDILQDKSKFKELCIKFGLPVVQQFFINPNNIASSIPLDMYPVITKPTDSSGSNGFSICYNSDDLEKGYILASNCSSSGSVICEKFVNNQGLVVFFSFNNGKMKCVLTEDKTAVKYEKQGSYVAGLFTCPSRWESTFCDLYGKKIEKMFSSIGIKEGTIWIEVFKDGKNFFFNEVGYRYGGSFSFYSVDYVSGINQFYSDLYFALTGENSFDIKSLIPSNIKRGLSYCIYPVHCKAGTISREEGLDDIIEKYKSNIVTIPHQKFIGDTISDSGSFGQVICLFHFVYNGDNELKDIISYIQNNYKVIDEKGNNMVINKLSINNSICS